MVFAVKSILISSRESHVEFKENTLIREHRVEEAAPPLTNLRASLLAPFVPNRIIETFHPPRVFRSTKTSWTRRT